MAGLMADDSQLWVTMLQQSTQHAPLLQIPAALVQMAQAPVPSVLENCLPDPIGSLGAGVAIAVLLMIAVGTGAWMLAGIPEAASPTLLLLPGGSRPGTAAISTVSSPLLRRRGRRLDALEGLRTVLVMYIVIYHVRWALPPLMAPWFQTGHWAVQFFFVLSGFVAACAHEATSGTQPIGKDAARTMAVRRLTRLCLPYFIALLGVAAVVAFRGGGEPFLAWPIQALMLQSLMPVKVCGPLDVGHWSQNFLPFAANGEGWFVSAILITSLCFPLLHNARPRGGFTHTLIGFFFIVFMRSVPTALTMAGWCPFDTYTFAPVRLLEFASGVLSAQLYKEKPAWLSDFAGWHWVFDASLLCAVVPVWLLGSWHTWAVCEGNHGDYFLTAAFCLTCFAARGISEQQGDVPEEEKSTWGELRHCSPLAGLLSSWFLVAPAMYSYQAYVYQEIFMAMLTQLPHAAILQYWWFPVPCTWVAAALSVHLLEEPLRRAVEARIKAARHLSLSK